MYNTFTHLYYIIRAGCGHKKYIAIEKNGIYITYENGTKWTEIYEEMNSNNQSAIKGQQIWSLYDLKIGKKIYVRIHFRQLVNDVYYPFIEIYGKENNITVFEGLIQS